MLAGRGHLPVRDGSGTRFLPRVRARNPALTATANAIRVGEHPKDFTASKMMCWVAAQRGADLARERCEDDRAQRWQAGADELTKDGLVLRYKVDGTDTRFSGAEGTFTICSFWLVTTLAMIGETERARGLCQKLLSLAGPLQLYAEEIDTATGQHLGNFPQAFTHLALIEAVSRLIQADQEANPASVA